MQLRVGGGEVGLPHVGQVGKVSLTDTGAKVLN